MTNFVWFRNDLRLLGSKVLEMASQSKELHIPIFILDPHILENKDTSPSRLSFMAESLLDVQNRLRSLGSDLLIVKSDPVIFWKNLCTDNQISILISRDYSNYAKKRDTSVQKIVAESGGSLTEVKNLVVFDSLDELLTQQKNPIKVFTAFKRAWLRKLQANTEELNIVYNQSELFLPSNLIEEFTKKNNLEVVTAQQLQNYVGAHQKGGETVAIAQWESFKKTQLQDYTRTRDIPSIQGTSMLSAHYKWGTISPYFVVRDLIADLGNSIEDYKQFMGTELAGHEMYLSELIWREFYKYILDYHPESAHANFNPKYNSIKWENDPALFSAWCQGKTGYPIVDAFMRQLNNTGWMHNRGRMIVGSFLCKDLHIDWKWGERYFKQTLIDYDVAANVGGWQWVAGTGTDAAPYFRIFNPVEQGKRFDAEGAFIKNFIPELNNFDSSTIHTPWKSTIVEQEFAECMIGVDYPAPIIDHAKERLRALKLYKPESF